jgi:hypothetical protein
MSIAAVQSSSGGAVPTVVLFIPFIAQTQVDTSTNLDTVADSGNPTRWDGCFVYYSGQFVDSVWYGRNIQFNLGYNYDVAWDQNSQAIMGSGNDTPSIPTASTLVLSGGTWTLSLHGAVQSTDHVFYVATGAATNGGDPRTVKFTGVYQPNFGPGNLPTTTPTVLFE